MTRTPSPPSWTRCRYAVKPSYNVLVAIEAAFAQWEASGDAMEYLAGIGDDDPAFANASSVALFAGCRGDELASVRIVVEHKNDPLAQDEVWASLHRSCTYDEFERIVLGLLIHAGAKLDAPEEPEPAPLAPGEDPFAL
jgi:hypothetical protein